MVQRRVLYPVSSGQTSATSLVETASQTEPGEGGGGIVECFDESTDFTRSVLAYNVGTTMELLVVGLSSLPEFRGFECCGILSLCGELFN